MRVVAPDSEPGTLDRLRQLVSPDGAAHPDARALETLLAPALDDSWVLIVSPRLPGVDDDMRGLLVGPGGVRALLVRRWHGRFRQRGRVWEFNARGKRGWIPCRTDPTRDARRVVDQVGSWMMSAIGTRLPLDGVVAFPDRHCHVELLNDPVTEVVTLDNATSWASQVGRVRLIDGKSAGRLLEAVLTA